MKILSLTIVLFFVCSSYVLAASSKCPPGLADCIGEICEGNEGPPGPVGPVGPQGENGATGSQGSRGATGASGTNGVSGTNGTNGVDGVSGSNGTDGKAGEDGDAGTDGKNGVKGSTGSVGDIGATGATGATGADGRDASIEDIKPYLNDLEDDYSVGVSGAMALAMIEKPRPGRFMLGLGYGHYAGADSLAINIGKSWEVESKNIREYSIDLGGFYGESGGSSESGFAGSLNFHF